MLGPRHQYWTFSPKIKIILKIFLQLFTIFEESQNTSSEICEVLEYCDPVQETDAEVNNQKHKTQGSISERKAKTKHTRRSSKAR